MEASETSHNGRHSLSSSQIIIKGMRTAFKSTMKIQKRDGMIMFVRRRSSQIICEDESKYENGTPVLAIALLSGSILITLLIALACMTYRSSRKRKEVMKEDENQDYGEGYEI